MCKYWLCKIMILLEFMMLFLATHWQLELGNDLKDHLILPHFLFHKIFQKSKLPNQVHSRPHPPQLLLTVLWNTLLN